MKNLKNSVLTIATMLIVIGIIISSFLTEYTSLIATITTTITAVIGAVALFIQFKKDKEINKASFLLEVSKQFQETYGCGKIFELIELSVVDSSIDLDKELSKISHMMDIENYLSWCMTLASLIGTNTITISDIDTFFAYRFFAIVNNKTVQDIELLKYHEDYPEVLMLYKEWHAYRIKHNKNIPFIETDLCLNENYSKIINSINKTEKNDNQIIKQYKNYRKFDCKQN